MRVLGEMICSMFYGESYNKSIDVLKLIELYTNTSITLCIIYIYIDKIYMHFI